MDPVASAIFSTFADETFRQSASRTFFSPDASPVGFLLFSEKTYCLQGLPSPTSRHQSVESIADIVDSTTVLSAMPASQSAVVAVDQWRFSSSVGSSASSRSSSRRLTYAAAAESSVGLTLLNW